jgi:hypothetical protein
VRAAGAPVRLPRLLRRRREGRRHERVVAHELADAGERPAAVGGVRRVAQLAAGAEPDARVGDGGAQQRRVVGGEGGDEIGVALHRGAAGEHGHCAGGGGMRGGGRGL